MIPRRLAVAATLAVACGAWLSPIPPAAVLAAAEPLCALGHPMATFVRGEIVGVSSGACGGGSHDRYVDLDVYYDRKGEQSRMRVRIYVHEMEPCRITTQVLEDTGPPPLLLDNGIASQAVGEELCRRLAEVDG